MRESRIEKYLVKRVKEEGGLTRKVRWLDRKGAPDRFVSFPGIHGWAEVKREGVEDPDPHQAREMERLRAHGHRVYLVNSFETADAMIDDLLLGGMSCLD